MRALLLAAAVTVRVAWAVPAPNTIEVVGDSGVSAQQAFVAQNGMVYVVDKTEGNPMQVAGHSAWASVYDPVKDEATAMDIVTNTFCAGGNVLGNGTWVNAGGNQPVLWGGQPTNFTYEAPYFDYDGGLAIRTLDPTSDSPAWTDYLKMQSRRWYPSLETLPQGNMIIIGGCSWGNYVNDAGQNEPSFEYFPSQGAPIGLNILKDSLPANLFVVTYLLPSGNLFINSNWQNEIFDYKNNVEYALPNIPHAVRTYPGSAAVAMMPLTPANNWTATLLFCGGTNLQPDQWSLNWNIAAYPADASCVSITPDESTQFVDEDPLPSGRVMGNFIYLPDGRLVLINGIGKGTAGYSNQSWTIGQSIGDDPQRTIYYYDRQQKAGSRWADTGAVSTVNRMYHSSATLLPDGSIWSSGSNPNADYIKEGTPGYPYWTEYRVEKFYPDYYNKTRPQPQGLPTSLSYGGQSFNVELAKSEAGNLDNTKVTLIRPGFSTHAINFGQRFLQLNNTYTVNSDGSATLHVSQLPPNPAVLAPGPALLFVVADGVPSTGTWVMIGNGQLGEQPVSAASQLPPFSGGDAGQNWNGGAFGPSSNSTTSTSSASATASTSSALALEPILLLFVALVTLAYQ